MLIPCPVHGKVGFVSWNTEMWVYVNMNFYELSVLNLIELIINSRANSGD